MERSNPNRIRRLAVAAGFASIFAMVACGGSSSDAGSKPAPAASKPATPDVHATLHAGDRIPAPTGAVLLTVSGKIAAANQGTVQLDEATLERVGLRTFTVFEPFEKADLEFEGVALDDLLGVLRPSDGVKTVHLSALDDYVVDLPLDQIMAGGTYIALAKADGSAIPVAEGGPARVVFGPASDLGENENNWIWSLATADLR